MQGEGLENMHSDHTGNWQFCGLYL